MLLGSELQLYRFFESLYVAVLCSGADLDELIDVGDFHGHVSFCLSAQDNARLVFVFFVLKRLDVQPRLNE